MRKLIVQLAVSLDSFIEGPHGEFDWCFTDGDYGMSDFFKRIDAIFIGRKSYEVAIKSGGTTPPGFPVLKEYVFSNTMKDITGNRVLVNGDISASVKKIKNEPGKDIWLFGGADLTASLLNYGLVDEMTLAVHPVLLGGGKPLFQIKNKRINLELIASKTYSDGLILLSYRFK